MAHASIYIDADDSNLEIGDSAYLLNPMRVQVEYGEDDGTRECQHCHEPIELASFNQGTEDAPNWTELWTHKDGKTACDPALELAIMQDQDYDLEQHGSPHAEPISLGCAEIVNSASVNFDDDEQSCTVTISVGDPRGAFAMTVRRTPGGKLILHVPHEGEPMPHMPLRKLHEGTYEIL